MLAFVGFLSIALAAGDPAEVSADRIVLAGQSVEAIGDVAVEYPLGHFTADSLSFEASERGSVAFYGEGLRWTPCTCPQAPWGVRAEEGEGVVGEDVVLRKAALEACGVPILPIPRLRIPLNERAPRVLFPEIGQGKFGGRLALPLWIPVAKKSGMVLAPEYRFKQAIMQRTEVSGPSGGADLSIAKELQSGNLRGEAGARGGIDDGLARMAIDSRWLSDQDYLDDYGKNFSMRAVPFAEQLMVAGVGPLRLESNTFDRGMVQRPLGAVFSLAGENIGPVAIQAESRLDWIEMGTDETQLQRGDATLGVSAGRTIGVLEGRWALGARAMQWSDGGPWSQAHVTSALVVPFWGRVGDTLHVAELGVEAGMARHDGALEDRLEWVTQEPRWHYGPTLRSTFVGPTGVPFSSDIRLVRTVAGWMPSFMGKLSRKDLNGWIQADPELQSGRVGYANEAISVGGGVVHGAELLQSFADVSVLTVRGFRPGWSGLYGHDENAWIRQGPRLAWDSGCNCLAINVGVEWAKDRDFPDAWLQLDLRPTRAKDRQ